MEIYLAADHGGHALKQNLFELLKKEGHEVFDCGNAELNPTDDYPDYVAVLAHKMQGNLASLGIVICRNGVGVSIAANRFPYLRAALGFNPTQVQTARQDDNANVLALPADYLSESEAINLIRIFLDTPFSNEERHVRRLAKIQEFKTAA